MSRREGFKTWSARLLVALLLPGLSGCLTRKLWEGDYDNSDRYWAATNTPPTLFQTKDRKDVLVCYLECNGKNAEKRERAYLLYQNRWLVEGSKAPKFVNSAGTEKLPPVPLTQTTNGSSDVNDETLRAVLDKNGRHFILVSKGREVGAFALPDYFKDDKNLKRALLTPLTVTADTVIFALAAGSIVGLFWWATDLGPNNTIIDSHWKP